MQEESAEHLTSLKVIRRINAFRRATNSDNFLSSSFRRQCEKELLEFLVHPSRRLHSLKLKNGPGKSDRALSSK